MTALVLAKYNLKNYYNSKKKYYTINEKVAIENFYERNKYYYLTPED